MARKKEIKVETFAEFRDRMVKELSVEDFNIMAFDIKHTLGVIRDLANNVNALKVLMSDKYKQSLQAKFPNADVKLLGSHDIKEFRERIKCNLGELAVSFNSIKQIERLPSVWDIVRMIENEPNGEIIRL